MTRKEWFLTIDYALEDPAVGRQAVSWKGADIFLEFHRQPASWLIDHGP